jgi:hypothetical protein
MYREELRELASQEEASMSVRVGQLWHYPVKSMQAMASALQSQAPG